ncbi:16S rRNA (cytidine(1402)-2'-O)-methyltransferase [Alphaproteobacteria bacterium]|nr:16S rRNA (cytidine(1402)-2'-O)-methyltransferase [Alphaproteobacteria bacterium]
MKKLSKEYRVGSEEKSLRGCLYIIATPIGNFDDISLRAIKLFNFVDILLCEDTRKTKKLLSHLDINLKNLISYNDINAEKKRPFIIKQLLMNKNVGLVSDAGSPLISDPGYKLIQESYSNEIKVTHAPGPSSVLNAIILSGLPTNQFYFGGFVDSKKGNREKQFLSVRDYKMTGIWFDTCLRLQNTLETMYKVFGNRKISIARELTKIYEEIISSDLKNIKNILKIREEKNIPLKGEIVLVVAGISQLAEFDIKKIRESIRNKLNTMSLKDTVELISTEERISKKLIYKEAIKIKDKF